MEREASEFRKQLLETFTLEASEHLQTISSGLLALEQSSRSVESMGMLDTIYRAAHSLKGAARAVDCFDIETICQGVESNFAALKRGEVIPHADLFDALHAAMDAVSSLLAGNDLHDVGIATVLQVLEQQRNYAQSGAKSAAPDPYDTSRYPAIAITSHAESPPQSAASPQYMPMSTPLPESSGHAPLSVQETIRVPLPKLDRLLSETEGMLELKFSARHHAQSLGELTEIVDAWKKQSQDITAYVRQQRRRATDPHQSKITDRLAEFLEWNAVQLDTLESRLHELSNSAQLDSFSLSSSLDSLLEAAKELVLLPFAQIFDPLPKMARDLARSLGKEVTLDISGGEITVERRILEGLRDPLIHLIRNAIDHGVEPPAARERAGKPRVACLAIRASRRPNNEIEVLVSDDGAGIDFEAVKAIAARHGYSDHAIAELSVADACALVFLTDVSTAPLITELSGRGVGLAIVRENVEKLGGQVGVESCRGTSTTFSIRLPHSLASLQGMLVRAGGRDFVVPTAGVERVIQVQPGKVTTVEQTESITCDGQVYAVTHLTRLLDLPPSAGAAGEVPLPAMVLAQGSERLVMLIDEVLDVREVLVKGFGPQLVRVPNLAGAAVLGSGLVAPVLNIADIFKAARHAAKPLSTAVTPEQVRQQAPTILVVEDSITSRMLLKNILISAGYRVLTAIDGIDAITVLKTEACDLVLSDIEMPRMNGFVLTETIRRDAMLADLPVVLVTSLDSPKDRERGVEVGANAYIVKSSFDHGNLLEIVHRFI